MTKRIDWDLAKRLLAEGKTQTEAAAAVGTSQSYLSQRLGKRRVKPVEAAPAEIVQ